MAVMVAADKSAEMSVFAETIYKDKYSLKDNQDNPIETWSDTAWRVAINVLGALGYTEYDSEVIDLYKYINQRKFIPGGRYLYASGREMHQTNNCFTGNTRIVTKHGIFSLEEIYSYISKQVIIRNRFGEWESGEVHSFGKQPIYRIIFSNGDTVDATIDHRWWQKDGTRVTSRELKSVPFCETKDIPEISVEGVRHGIVFGDGTLPKGENYSRWDVVNPEKDQALVSWFNDEEREIVVGGGAIRKYRTIRQVKGGTKVALQPAHYKSLPDQLCDPEYARGFIAGLIATDGCVSPTGSVTIHQEGFDKARYIAEIAVLGGCIVNSVRIVSTISPYTGLPRELCQISIKPFSVPIILPSHQTKLNSKQRKRMMELGVESIEDTGRVEDVYCVVVPGSESFTLANGLITSNCFLYKAEDSREGWSELGYKTRMALMTGGGIGVDYSNIREYGARISKTGGVSTGPLALMQMTNDDGRHIMQGGARRSALWAGLNWQHPDIEKFIRIKDWSTEVRAAKAKDFNFPAPMDGTNISVLLDDDFFDAYQNQAHPKHDHAHHVYHLTIKRMVKTGEPGFSVDIGLNAGETCRNACTEITSSDDSDVCNLGSINLARMDNKEEFAGLVDLATLFLLAGTVYSDVPHEEIYETRQKNRRLGLGVMGVHEWLLKRGYRYEPNDELSEWLDIYANQSDNSARAWANFHNLSIPVKKRAIAPTGTIGIIGETTTGIEPIFCVAYKRRYLNGGNEWHYQYVIDPTAERLIQAGVDPYDIEDAYTLSLDIERRLEFQAWIQGYVDHAISSTINLPYPITDDLEVQEFADTLYKYLPRLRGITVYPDGARGGQPLSVESYEVAKEQEGLIFVEHEDKCLGGVCGV